MNQQTILAVDDQGKFLEYIPKEAGHTGKGRRHLAITVLLFNSKNQVLLQKRKHQIFDNIWDLTGATHPLHKPHSCHSERQRGISGFNLEIASSKTPRNDRRCKICNADDVDESLEEATIRCLREELGIDKVEGFRRAGVFNYFAQYGDFCENEHCYLMLGKYDGEVKMDPNMGYEYKWIDESAFLIDIAQNPQYYTPWAQEGIKLLK